MRQVESDFSHWNGSFSVINKNLSEGIDALENARKTVESYLIKNGFTPEEISFGRIYTDETFKDVTDAKGNRSSEFQYFDLSQSVYISSSKVHAVEKVSREATSLIKQGIRFVSRNTSYTISDLDKFKMELLAEATRNATERAEVLASNSRGKVGSLLSASQGIFQIAAPASSDISSYGEYDKSTILKEIKAVVTLKFSVEKR